MLYSCNCCKEVMKSTKPKTIVDNIVVVKLVNRIYIKYTENDTAC